MAFRGDPGVVGRPCSTAQKAQLTNRGEACCPGSSRGRPPMFVAYDQEAVWAWLGGRGGARYATANKDLTCR